MSEYPLKSLENKKVELSSMDETPSNQLPGLNLLYPELRNSVEDLGSHAYWMESKAVSPGG